MSETFEKYDKYYKECTKMFSKALARILESDLPYKVKLDHMHRVDEYIDIASKKRILIEINILGDKSERTSR